MATDPHIGTTIKRARERKRWTQRQLADALAVDRKTIDNWENGRTSPRSSIGALEDVLGISLSGGAAVHTELVPEDEWEARVLADPDLPGDEKRWLVTESRAARAAYAEARRRRAARAAARSGPGTAAG
jgi:transcriptional regulator with XRE-family HTH domain